MKGDGPVNGIIIKNLSKSFGEKKVFSNLNAVLSNFPICITGPSGCGKTTLVRIIAGIETKDFGNIEGVIGNVAFMFQEPRLFPSFSAIDNITCVSRNKNSFFIAKELLNSLGIDDDAMTKKPCELSGGMKQRVALARTVMFHMESKGNTVILDEPFKELDISSKELAVKLVSDKFASTNLIIITHDRDDALMLNARLIDFSEFISNKSL